MKKLKLKWLSVILCVGLCIISLNLYSLTYQIKTQNVSVDTTATKLPTTPLVGREYVLVTNKDTSTTLYVGASDVSTSIGTPVLPSESWYGEYDHTVDIYGRVGSGSVNVTVQEGK